MTAPAGSTTKIVTYEYDAFDRRIAKTLDTGTIGSVDRREYYVWSGEDVIFDFVDPDGVGAQPAALSKRYLWGEAVDQLLAQEDVSTGVLWALGDHLNTTRDLVDNAGAVQTHYKYDAFGNLKAGDATKTRFLYTSQEYDSDTGLVYYNARWYDPRTGTFLSQDSWGFAAGDENLTRYVGNSPTNWVDPTGHAPIGSDTLLPPREQEPNGELPPTVPPYPPSFLPDSAFPWDYELKEAQFPDSPGDFLTKAQKEDMARTLGYAGAFNRAMVRDLHEQRGELQKIRALVLGKLMRAENGLCRDVLARSSSGIAGAGFVRGFFLTLIAA